MRKASDRKIQGYPRPGILSKFNEYHAISGMTKSEIVVLAIKEFLERLPNYIKVQLSNNSFDTSVQNSDKK